MINPCQGGLPKSAILNTPLALELLLRCFVAVGEEDKPEMAESTLVKSEGISTASEDMMDLLMLIDGRNLGRRVLKGPSCND